MALRVLIAFLTAVALGHMTAAAAAADVLVVSDDDVLTVTEDDSGTWSGTLAIANAGPTEASVMADGGDDCTVRAEPPSVPPGRQLEVTFVLSNCGSPEPTAGRELTVTAGELEVTVTVAVDDGLPEVDLGVLQWFGYAALFAAAVTAFTMARWFYLSRATTSDWYKGLGLDPSWSFTSSWASNLTAVTAAVVGVFGVSDVASSILGASADDTVATVLVGSAVALVLIGVAPLVLQTFRTVDGAITPVGLALAALFTLTGSAGELGVVVSALEETELGGMPWLPIAAVSGAIVLAVYAGMSTYAALNTSDEPDEPQDSSQGAETLLLALPRSVRQMALDDTPLATLPHEQAEQTRAALGRYLQLVNLEREIQVDAAANVDALVDAADSANDRTPTDSQMENARMAIRQLQQRQVSSRGPRGGLSRTESQRKRVSGIL